MEYASKVNHSWSTNFGNDVMAAHDYADDADRFVQLPGSAEFEEDLIHLVKAVVPDVSAPESGCFVIEFHDAQGAEIYRQRLFESACGEACGEPCPPSLQAPPGLESSSCRETSLADDMLATFSPAVQPLGDTASANQVLLSGLPLEISSCMMMEVILEQAGLEDDVVGPVTVTKGRRFGEARISFCSAQAAMRCQKHFEGSRWCNNICAQILQGTQVAEPQVTMNKTRLSTSAPVCQPSDVAWCPAAFQRASVGSSTCANHKGLPRATSDTSTEASTESDGDLSEECPR